jgi:hypothetical protein
LIYINIPILVWEDDIISCYTNQGKRAARAESRSSDKAGSLARYILPIALCVILIIIPTTAGASPDISEQPADTGPQIVNTGVYAVDFNRFSVADGTLEANFYLTLTSDANISINDIEIMNGHATSMDTIVDTPYKKEYRIDAALTADPDLRRYPFDRHTLPIIIEPRLKDEREMVLVIDPANTGLDSEADLPGWQFTGTSSAVTNRSYVEGEVPYSRAVFNYSIGRDAASTILKFFLPIMLIIIVSLSSLMMKISSRLGLNASMFLAAVLIHWRIADVIPLVAYATFLDLFMMITYATLVMVLVSGILILKFMEAKDMARADKVNYWSLRIIPPISITLYFLVFLTLVL